MVMFQTERSRRRRSSHYSYRIKRSLPTALALQLWKTLRRRRNKRILLRTCVATVVLVYLLLLVAAFQYVTRKPIPHILHFIYISKGLPIDVPQAAMPSYVAENIEAWQALHPDWEVIIWNNRKVRDTFPAVVPLLEQLYPLAWVSDVVRYHALEKYGGVYVDTDVIPLRPMDAVANYYYPAFCVCEWPKNNTPLPEKTTVAEYQVTDVECYTTGTAVIGSVPYSWALQHARAVSVRDSWAELHLKQTWNHTGQEENEWVYTSEVTGPQKWTQSVKRYRVPMLQQSTFFPCHWDGDKSLNNTPCNPVLYVDEPHVYAVHMWDGSWAS